MSLHCENIVKTYGGKDVLHDVTLDLQPGKIYGLIGRNGAGKTTLLSILSAQNPATRGSVTLDGEPVWEHRQSLAKICFSRELSANAESGLAAMKAKEYLRIAATYYEDWDKALEARLVKLFDLNVKKKLGKMSKGMLSMITIVVALCSKAPYTFLDEPVAGLDVVAREQFYKLLLEEYSSSGRTFVVSTHIIEEAADVLEEVVILHEGKILLKENTQTFVDSAVHVSGKAEEVDAATAGLEVHHPETIGRSKGVTVFLKPGQAVDESRDVSVQPASSNGLSWLCAERRKPGHETESEILDPVHLGVRRAGTGCGGGIGCAGHIRRGGTGLQNLRHKGTLFPVHWRSFLHPCGQHRHRSSVRTPPAVHGGDAAKRAAWVPLLPAADHHGNYGTVCPCLAHCAGRGILHRPAQYPHHCVRAADRFRFGKHHGDPVYPLEMGGHRIDYRSLRPRRRHNGLCRRVHAGQFLHGEDGGAGGTFNVHALVAGGGGGWFAGGGSGVSMDAPAAAGGKTVMGERSWIFLYGIGRSTAAAC